MRLLLTGASGFVGSNIAKVCGELAGDELITDRVDMTDAQAVADHVRRSEPDATVHCAILNDWSAMMADRQLAWDSYVTATRAYADAAAAIDVPFALVSTDWVFDGTQSRADEDTPANPVNLYGFLKAASELVTVERGGAVARVSGVNGTHWARPETPRAQDPGFGYFVASLVDALEAGQPFTVWEADNINMVASPSSASMCGEVIRAIVAGGHRGTFHCCGQDAVTRRDLAEATVDVFGLDRSLLRFANPPEEAVFATIPYDTSLSAEKTSATLGTPLPSITELLTWFRAERATRAIASISDARGDVHTRQPNAGALPDPGD